MDQETALSSRNTIEITQERSVADGRKFAQATYQDSNDIVYSAVDIEDADMNFRGELEADLSSTTFFNGNHNIETGQAELKFDDFEDQTVSQSDPGSSSELLDFSFNQTDSQKLSDSSMESAIQIEQDYFQDSGLHSKYGISAMNNGSADHPNLQMAYDEADQMASHEPFIKRKIEPRSSINNWEILTETESSEELIGLPESGIMENRMEGSLSIPDPAGIAMDAKMGDPTDSVETIPIPPEKVRMQLKLKFNAKTQHYEYKLPYNLLRLQKSAKQKLENRVR